MGLKASLPDPSRSKMLLSVEIEDSMSAINAVSSVMTQAMMAKPPPGLASPPPPPSSAAGRPDKDGDKDTGGAASDASSSGGRLDIAA
jgi:hypothetical protein